MSEEKVDMVTIPREHYEALINDSDFLDALHIAGVDNWDGYEEVKETLA